MAKLNISKNTGDTLSADELNKIVAAVDSKLDTIPGKGLSANDYTSEDKQKLIDLEHRIETIGTNVVTKEERQIGLFKKNDKEVPLYEAFLEITNPPRQAGGSTTIVLFNEPSEFIYPLGVSLKQDTTESFNRYSIGEVYLEDFSTKLVLNCEKNSPEGIVAIRLQYTKFSGRHLRFEIQATDNSTFNLSNIRFAPLKYNKKWACSYTIDDSPVEAYSRAFARINKKWIDDNPKFHVNTPRTTGYYPANFLVSTDGCGNDVRWNFLQAIFTSTTNVYNPEGIIKDTSITSTYITWEDINYMKYFGNTIAYHNVNSEKYDESNPVSIQQGFIADYNRAFEKTGLRMKIMARPDGNNNYITASLTSKLIYFLRTNGSGMIYPNLVNTSLYKKELHGITAASTYANKLEEFAAVATSSNPYWAGITTHTPDNETFSFLETLQNLYGKEGNDSVWMANIEEVFEYLQLKTLSYIKSEVIANKAIIDVYLPDFENFYFREISLLVDTTISAAKVVVSSSDTNVKNIVFRANDSTTLININYNEKAEEIAEIFTCKYERSTKEEDKEDALYLINNSLATPLRAPFLNRITSVTEPLPDTDVTAISITGGSEVKVGQTISLEIIYAPASTTQKGIIWSSTDTTKATVSNGVVTGIATGTVTIIAKSTYNSSVTDSVNVTITSSGSVDHGETFKIISCWSPGFSETYPTVNNEILNYFRGQYLTIKDFEILKDTKDITRGKLIMNKSLLPEFEGLGDASTSTGSNPVLSGNTGAYPDRYIEMNHGAYSSAANALVLRRFVDLPAGSYQLRFLVSMKPSTVSDISNQYFVIQGITTYLPTGYPYENNSSIFFEVDSIIVGNDGILDVYLGNNLAYGRSGFNLVEIIKCQS